MQISRNGTIKRSGGWRLDCVSSFLRAVTIDGRYYGRSTLSAIESSDTGCIFSLKPRLGAGYRGTLNWETRDDLRSTTSECRLYK